MTVWLAAYCRLKKLDKIPTAPLSSVWLHKSVQNWDYYKIKTLIGKIRSWQTSRWSDPILLSCCSVMLSTRLHIQVSVYVTSPGFLGEKKNFHYTSLFFFFSPDSELSQPSSSILPALAQQLSSASIFLSCKQHVSWVSIVPCMCCSLGMRSGESWCVVITRHNRSSDVLGLGTRPQTKYPV